MEPALELTWSLPRSGHSPQRPITASSVTTPLETQLPRA